MDKTIEQQARESIKTAIERQLNEQLFGAPAGTMTQETLAIGRVRAVIAGLRSGAYSGAGASDKIADELQAAIRALTRPAPTEAEVEASSLLKMIATEYLSVQPFDMPTGQGDADIGWQVVAPEGKVVADVFSDDLLAALRMARAALGSDPE